MIRYFKDLFAEVGQIYKYRYVIMAFTNIKLKQRYRRSVFGYLWTIFTPLINYVIMGTIISFIARGASTPNYFFYFMCASVYFGFLSNIISGSYTCLIHNENFIKKIYFPKSVFFLNIIVLEIINFALAFVTLYILALVFGFIPFSATFPIALLSVVVSIPFLYGVGLLVGIGAVYFRDLMHIIPAILQALYFLTPILYEPSVIPEEYRHFVYWNPLYYFVEAFRNPLWAPEKYSWGHLGIASGLAAVTFLLGFQLLRKMENKIVFKL